MLTWVYEIFFAKTYTVFTTIDSGELRKAKDKLRNAGIHKFKVSMGENHDIRFAASGTMMDSLKVFTKDYENAIEVKK